VHDLQTVAVDDPVAWASVCLSCTSVITLLPDGITLIWPLLHNGLSYVTLVFLLMLNHVR